MSNINLSEAREYLIELSKSAGEILKKYFYSGEFTVESKGGVDFLTQADKEVDTFLLNNLKKKFQGSSFFTEETAPADYSSLENIDNLWVVDPLDGTVNFSRKNSNFAISIALVDHGLPKLAVVYLPIIGDIYWAQADIEFAYKNNEIIKVSKTSELKETVIGCDWAWNLQKRLVMLDWLKNIVTHIRQPKSMGSAVADLCAVANGQLDAYLQSGLKPWDMAAAALIVEKAGGKITTANNEPWNAFCPEIFASNTLIHDKIINLINQK